MFGCDSWSRMIRAKMPPITKLRMPVTMYMIPISLWSVVVSQRLIGLKNVSSYAFGRGRTVVAIAIPILSTGAGRRRRGSRFLLGHPAVEVGHVHGLDDDLHGRVSRAAQLGAFASPLADLVDLQPREV